MHIRKFLRRMLERRQRTPKFQAEGLVAYYWEGGAPCPREVREIGIDGAYIAAPDGFYPGTLLQMVFEGTPANPGSGGANPHISVYAKALRRAADGFCVSFLFGEPSERETFGTFLQGLKRKDEPTDRPGPSAE